MPLTDKLDEVIACAVKLDRVELHATANVPFGQVDPAPLKAELEAAKKALLEDCLSKSETLTCLRDLHATLEQKCERDRASARAHPELPNAQRALSYSQAAAYYTAYCIEIVEKWPLSRPDPPQSS